VPIAICALRELERHRRDRARGRRHDQHGEGQAFERRERGEGSDDEGARDVHREHHGTLVAPIHDHPEKERAGRAGRDVGDQEEGHLERRHVEDERREPWNGHAAEHRAEVRDHFGGQKVGEPRAHGHRC
jgi:hypothetical protein